MDLLKDKTAVITGVHRGIGKAILEKFCEYGCNCFVINRKADPVFTEYCENLQKEYTILIIAHRLSTVINSDKIVVLQKGEIKEMGTHHELIAKNGIYKSLYERNFED